MGGLSSEAVARASEIARNRAAAADRDRRLPAETVRALADAGLFTLCLPERYGGPGIGPVGMVDAVAEVANADGAAGWCAGIASTTASLAAFLDPDVAATIFTSPAVATGGVFAPNGRGVSAADGARVTGRWAWGSGTQHCEWIVGGAMYDDETQRVCVFPVSAVEFHDTWHTAGLRGTGSLDFSVDEVFVADEWTIRPGVSEPFVDEPLARFPNFTLLALCVAAAGLGIARRALDEIAVLAGEKTPQFASRTLAASGFTQTEFARAEARWRAARAGLREQVEAAWVAACAGDPVAVDARVAIRLAAAHVASECVAITDVAWTLAGGTAVFDSHPLGRCMRDVHMVTQHVMVAPKLNETLGKHLLGVDIDARMI